MIDVRSNFRFFGPYTDGVVIFRHFFADLSSKYNNQIDAECLRYADLI